MKKKTVILAVLLFILMCCSACQIRNVTRGMEEGEHYDAVISIKKQDDSESCAEDSGQEDGLNWGYELGQEDMAVLQTMYSMPGMTDAEASGLLGGGKENCTADQSYLIGRNYQVSLFGESCAFYTSYGSKDTVELAYVILPDGVISRYGELLEQIYGKAEVSLNDAGEPVEWIWQKEGKMIWLYQDESIILDYSLDSYIE